MKAIKIITLGLACFLCIEANAQKVGFLLDSYVVDRWLKDHEYFRERIEALGGECITELADGDADRQVEQGKRLLNNGAVDVLVIVPVDAKKAVEIVNLAKEKNIPVISYDRLIMTDKISLYVAHDSEKVGNLQASSALNAVPSGNYLLINGPERDNNAILFRKGQLDLLQTKIDAGEINIIDDIVLDEWGELNAFMTANEFFIGNQHEIDAVIAANDGIASAVINSVSPENLQSMYITGQDAEVKAIKSILNGEQKMTVYKSIKELATTAANAAMKIANKQNVPDANLKNMGLFSVNTILLDPIIVDKDNYMDTVVKDGHIDLAELNN